ncbi:uncharacterized protein LOC109822733 isoform X3 [Asparagus officinalis]|uniref:uncharacterized protein LOC109822733 isoform X3 n=1 Tax=Asparagus officinalis TaxID=4686 RepID=UPI00098E4B21|nr:uncharacterized protein LOC109822733 isoform X3 [Asparagus officinalis]
MATGGTSMDRNLSKEILIPVIEESGGSSSALKEYLGTHKTLVDPNGDTYSCIYPDTQTQEYCIDSQTTRPPPVVPATTPPTLAHSPNTQGSISAA